MTTLFNVKINRDRPVGNKRDQLLVVFSSRGTQSSLTMDAFKRCLSCFSTSSVTFSAASTSEEPGGKNVGNRFRDKSNTSTDTASSSPPDNKGGPSKGGMKAHGSATLENQEEHAAASGGKPTATGKASSPPKKATSPLSAVVKTGGLALSQAAQVLGVSSKRAKAAAHGADAATGGGGSADKAMGGGGAVKATVGGGRGSAGGGGGLAIDGAPKPKPKPKPKLVASTELANDTDGDPSEAPPKARSDSKVSFAARAKPAAPSSQTNGDAGALPAESQPQHAHGSTWPGRRPGHQHVVSSSHVDWTRLMSMRAKPESRLAGRPAWDNTALRARPAALVGLKPVTREPWAQDEAVYNKKFETRQTGTPERYVDKTARSLLHKDRQQAYLNRYGDKYDGAVGMAGEFGDRE